MCPKTLPSRSLVRERGGKGVLGVLLTLIISTTVIRKQARAKSSRRTFPFFKQASGNVAFSSTNTNKTED